MSNIHEKRKVEFLWYHKNGDGDCNGQVLREYAEKKRLNQQDCFDLAYFYATTYCCASAVSLLDIVSSPVRSPPLLNLQAGQITFTSAFISESIILTVYYYTFFLVIII